MKSEHLSGSDSANKRVRFEKLPDKVGSLRGREVKKKTTSSLQKLIRKLAEEVLYNDPDFKKLSKKEQLTELEEIIQEQLIESIKIERRLITEAKKRKSASPKDRVIE
jgi:translation initiation factor 2B subunit (eIF-2B alpha/beta/delta family)